MAIRPPPFDRVFDRLSGRNWAGLAPLIAPFLPDNETLANICKQTARNIVTASGFTSAIPETGEYRVASLPGLRESILREGLLLLTKAIHVFCSATAQATQGYPSWSYVSAYHSGLFACQAILRLLGATMVQEQSSWIVIDVWPGPQKGRVQQARRYQRGSEVQFIRCNRVEQRHWWQLLSEVLADTEISSIWNNDLKDRLVDLSDRVFAQQRNSLIYDVGYWPYQDLVEPTPMTFLSSSYPKPLGTNDLQSPVDNFTTLVAIALIRFGMAMVRDLATIQANFAGVARQFEVQMQSVDAQNISRLGG